MCKNSLCGHRLICQRHAESGTKPQDNQEYKCFLFNKNPHEGQAVCYHFVHTDIVSEKTT